jgi:hypothetical protein
VSPRQEVKSKQKPISSFPLTSRLSHLPKFNPYKQYRNHKMILVIKVNVIQENIRSVDLIAIKLMVYNKNIDPKASWVRRGSACKLCYLR